VLSVLATMIGFKACPSAGNLQELILCKCSGLGEELELLDSHPEFVAGSHELSKF